MFPTRQATSMPSTIASTSSRPLDPSRSASASAGDANRPAGWMIVLRCVSSKSNVCDAMPFSSAGARDVDALAATEHGRLRRGLELEHRGEGRLDRGMARRPDRAAEPVGERAMRLALDLAGNRAGGCRRRTRRGCA
jgi:hypothetical protein